MYKVIWRMFWIIVNEKLCKNVWDYGYIWFDGILFKVFWVVLRFFWSFWILECSFLVFVLVLVCKVVKLVVVLVWVVLRLVVVLVWVVVRLEVVLVWVVLRLVVVLFWVVFRLVLDLVCRVFNLVLSFGFFFCSLVSFFWLVKIYE